MSAYVYSMSATADYSALYRKLAAFVKLSPLLPGHVKDFKLKGILVIVRGGLFGH